MKIKKLFFLISFALLFSIVQSCESNEKLPEGVKKVVLEEIIQTSYYTYLKVKEDGREKWLAVNLMQAKKGDTFYYSQAMLMNDFVSKELNRTFPEIYFLDNLSKTSDLTKEQINPTTSQIDASHHSDTGDEMQELKIEVANNGISISTLFKDKSKYAGKIVKIKGKVTKYNEGIMNKNWIHIQDGSANDGKFDLTITTNDVTKVNDIITIEGAISLDKDYGSGYKYEVIMENAKIIK